MSNTLAAIGQAIASAVFILTKRTTKNVLIL